MSGAAQGELRPTFTSVMAKRAAVLATHRSQAWAIIQPPAKATPFTAAIGGRIARVFIAETPGVYRPSWTVNDVHHAMPAIHDKADVLDFGLHGHVGHISYSFDMARKG
jgi:hypothetical protein